MKNKRVEKNSNIEYWIALSEKYFNAQTTGEEENALSQFLASNAANHPTFNEIKAVMGYLSTGKSIAKKNKHTKSSSIGKARQWASIAACIAVIAVIGTSIMQEETLVEPESKETEYYYAYIDGKEYTDEDIVMQQMLTTMNKMSYTSNGTIEEQMGVMLRINN